MCIRDRGKSERYLKDEIALDEYLLELAREDVHVEIDNQPPDADLLAQASEQYLQLTRLTQRLSRRYDETILSLLRRISPYGLPDNSDRSHLDVWVMEIQAALNVDNENSPVELNVTFNFETSNRWSLDFEVTTHGVPRTVSLDSEFFKSIEYRQLIQLSHSLETPQKLEVTRNTVQSEFRTMREALEWLLSDVKRGLQIQRYKGLGEMNPDQLAETTMNTDSRNLMQVRIEDVVAADEIFSTLMGDQVEPRRDFIERHALTVTNLDT